MVDASTTAGQLHEMLDEAAADYMNNTRPWPGMDVVTLRNIIDWNGEQAKNPNGEGGFTTKRDHGRRHSLLHAAMCELGSRYTASTGKRDDQVTLDVIVRWSHLQVTELV